MTARTARLAIEVLSQEHVDGLFAALDDDRVGRYIGGPDVTTVDALRARIELLAAGAPAESGETWLNWAVRLADAERPVIGRIEATLHDGIAEIAYVFGPAWWGRGYATEATTWLVDVLAARHDVASLWATVDPANTSSTRLLERLGFRRVEAPTPSLLSYDPGDDVFTRDP